MIFLLDNNAYHRIVIMAIETVKSNENIGKSEGTKCGSLARKIVSSAKVQRQCIFLEAM